MVDGAPDMIISVPHSGTRSVLKRLQLGGIGDAGGRWYMHFGLDDPEIEAFRGLAHIPLRDPVEIALSWESRHTNSGWTSIDNMHRAIDSMCRYKPPPGHTYYLTHQLQDHEGRSIAPHPGKEDHALALKSPRVQAFLQWYNDVPHVQAFYRQHFPGGFWWQATR